MMSQRMTVGAGLSIVIMLLTLHDASGQTAERRAQGAPAPADAVAEAQTPRVVPGTRPEQRQTAHDRSTVFTAPDAPSSSPALAQQPEQGQIQGFDFYRDPLNAKKPLMTFDELMQADEAAKSAVMATQRQLL